MHRNPATARALEEHVLPALPHATVYWREDGQSAVVLDHGPQPYVIVVEPDGEDVRTYSTAGDEWQVGWDV